MDCDFPWAVLKIPFVFSMESRGIKALGWQILSERLTNSLTKNREAKWQERFCSCPRAASHLAAMGKADSPFP